MSMTQCERWGRTVLTGNVLKHLALVAGLGAGLHAGATPLVWINEIHYDNDGTDTDEFVEIAGPAGTDLNGYSLVLYNGSGGAPYGSSISLSGMIPDLNNSFGALTFSVAGIQNGPDGIALADGASMLLQFLSYEGAFTGVGGPADGVTSVDIGFSQTPSTPLGQSLQLIGTGAVYEDFTWTGPADASFGSINAGQQFTGEDPPDNTVPDGGSALALLGLAFLSLICPRKDSQGEVELPEESTLR